MKDIFIDTNTAQQFCNPANESYKVLLEWLKKEGILVYNNNLIIEIGRGNQNLLVIIDYLIKRGRTNHISKSQLNKFNFSKKQYKTFLCNSEDRVHLKSIVLSHRKIVIAKDLNLLHDVNNLPKYNGIQPIGVDDPDKINYK